jgi:hypothetical protein
LRECALKWAGGGSNGAPLEPSEATEQTFRVVPAALMRVRLLGGVYGLHSSHYY